MCELGMRSPGRLAAIAALICLAWVGRSQANVLYSFDGNLPNSGVATFSYDAPSYIAASASTSCADSAGGPCSASLIGSSVIISYDESIAGFQLPTMAPFTFPNNAFLAGGTYNTVASSFAAGTLTVTPPNLTPPPPPPQNSNYIWVTENTANNNTLLQLSLSIGTSASPAPDSYQIPDPIPTTDTTLSAAAEDLGFDYLAVAQEVSIPAGPSPYYACTALDCSTSVNVSNATVPDAPQYGWVYCNPNSVYFTGTAGVCLNYPFVTPLTPLGNTATYTDNPADDCLFGGTGDACGGQTTTATNNALVFLTTLDGVNVDAAGAVGGITPLYTLDWSDTYNGTSGGISTTFNELPVDPGSGSGRITILSVNGVPVPEPSTTTLLMPGLSLLWLLRRRKRFKNTMKEILSGGTNTASLPYFSGGGNKAAGSGRAGQRFLVLSIAAILATAPLAANSPANAAAYGFTQIDVPGATSTGASGINDAGQIVGSFVDSAGITHGFLDTGGSFTQLDVPGATLTQPFGINAAALISGYFFNGPITNSTVTHGFLYTSGSFTQLDVPATADTTMAIGINDAGQISGYFFSAGITHGFLDAGGSFTQLDVPGATDTAAFGINDAAQIVGAFGDSTGTHGFLDTGGSFTQLDGPGATVTVALGVNNAVQIVGEFINSTGTYGFLDTGGSFIQFDVPDATLTEAVGNNDAGQIVGAFDDSTGTHGFLATPATVVPEPATLTLLSIGITLTGLAMMMRRRATSPKCPSRTDIIIL